MSAEERLQRIDSREQEIYEGLAVYGQFYVAKKLERICVRDDEDAKLKKKIEVIFSVARRWDMSMELATEAYEIINNEKEIPNE
jgi:hypothetical protein